MSERRSGAIPSDRSEYIGGALVHHGPVSDRAYLLKPGADPVSDIATLEGLASEYGYGKIFAKALSGSREPFEDAGFVAEARVPLAHCNDEMIFYSRFLDAARRTERTETCVEQVLGESAAAAGSRGTDARTHDAVPAVGLSPEVASRDDAEEIARLYSDVFESYPFPIGSPEYVTGEMDAGTVFVLVRDDDRIIAVASAEIDPQTRSCEMTDFATSPDRRGKGLASALLERLEAVACERGVVTAYTIARARSTGMNIVFARCGYSYGGLLINNTGICGAIESMNVWYRSLGEGPSA